MSVDLDNSNPEYTSNNIDIEEKAEYTSDNIEIEDKEEEIKLEGTYRITKEKKKKSTDNHNFKCQYCQKPHSSRGNVNIHENERHLIRTEDVTENNPNEFLCKVCPIPVKYTKKYNLKIHGIRTQKGVIGVIQFGSFVVNDSEDEIKKQILKTGNCQLCGKDFTCRQTLNIHKREVHNISESFQCAVCPKVYDTKKQLRCHRSYVH